MAASQAQPSPAGSRDLVRPAGPAGPASIHPGAWCSCELDFEPGPAGRIAVVRVAGEIDLVSLPSVGSALDAALDQHPADLVVDMAGVGFCGVRGFALLATAAGTAASSGIGYSVSGMLPSLDRIATLLWPERRCVRYRSVVAAVTAIRLDHTSRVS